jgi:hypothetical protein
MLFPKIADYSDCQKYMHDFYEINKESRKTFSYRFLAKKLNWPVSYLNDVIHGRRILTLQRALEFSTFGKLDLVETERLIYMTMKDANQGGVQQYFIEKLDKECNADTSSNPDVKHIGLIDEMDTCIDELKGDLSACVVLKVLAWGRGEIELMKIPTLLYTFPDIADEKVLLQKIYNLEKNKNIEIHSYENGILKYKVHRSSIFFVLNADTLPLMGIFPDNMGRLLRHKKATGFFNTGVVIVRRNRANEARQRINMLKNWLLELDREAQELDESVAGESIAFQYDMNLAAVMDYRELGFKSLRDWAQNEFH